MSTIMIAENEPGARRHLTKVLLKEKHRVEWVKNVEELLDEVEIHTPDVLLLDMVMPKMNGMKLAEKLRERGRNIPIMMMTAKGATPAAIPEWATDYLAKPLDPQELLFRIKRALASKAFHGRIPPVSHPELHDPESGRIDAANVADFLAIPLSQLAEALGALYATVHKTPAGVGLQKSLRPIKRGIELVTRVTRNASEARMWLNTPHPDLRGETPLEVILAGRANALVTILENALAGIPS
jgi:DNA-binding NtrC family response regulator